MATSKTAKGKAKRIRSRRTNIGFFTFILNAVVVVVADGEKKNNNILFLLNKLIFFILMLMSLKYMLVLNCEELLTFMTYHWVLRLTIKPFLALKLKMSMPMYFTVELLTSCQI